MTTAASSLDPTLKVGYTSESAYLQSCALRNDEDIQRRFTLNFALQHWEHSFPPNFLLSRLGIEPRCLIQGSASVENVEEFVSFLARQGICAPRIHVLDLIDLQALGYANPHATYHRADAADLAALFDSGTFDCVVQDHLLNCAPFALYSPILGEVARILRQGGMAFVHYTDSSGFPQAKGQALGRYLLGSATEYTLELPAALQAAFIDMPVQERLIATADGHILATTPFGNLEHFLSFSSLAERFLAAGLSLEDHKRLNVLGGEGLDCRRNYCIVSPRCR